MRIYTSTKQTLFLIKRFLILALNSLQNKCNQLLNWLASKTQTVSSKQERETPEKPVVSESSKEKPIFIKFTLVPDGIRMESNSGDGSVEESASFSRLLFQLTEGKQNNNIVKHLEMTIQDEKVKKHIYDIWQTLKALDYKQKTSADNKQDLVVRPSQVLQNSKGF